MQVVRHLDMARRLWDAQEVTRDSNGAQGRVFAALNDADEVCESPRDKFFLCAMHDSSNILMLFRFI